MLVEEDVQILDSGYILHFMQKGVSKGRTLMRLLGRIGDGSLSSAEVLAVGDSTTDLSLFELFHDSVLILNPRLPIEESQVLQRVARYVSEHPHVDGFTAVVLHVIDARACGD